jgi:hypothetical protein
MARLTFVLLTLAWLLLAVGAQARMPANVNWYDEFTYGQPTRALNGNGGWSGSATTDIYAWDNWCCNIVGGSGSIDSCKTGLNYYGNGGIVWVHTDVLGYNDNSNAMWSIWIDDELGRNHARLYGSDNWLAGISGGNTTSTVSLTDRQFHDIDIRINTSAHTADFYANGAPFGQLGYPNGQNTRIDRVRIERMDSGAAAGAYLLMGDIFIGEDDVTPPITPGSPFRSPTCTPLVRFNWSSSFDPGSGLAGYYVQVGTSPGASNIADSWVGNTTSYQFTGVSGTVYYCRVYARDNAGNQSAWSGTGSSAATSFPPVMQVGGKPFFPIGYYTSTAPSSVESARDYLLTQHAQGMNTALSCYSIWCCGDAYMTNEVQGAALADMKVAMEVNRYAARGDSGYPASLIDSQVDLLKNYPNMLGWYLMDEPEVQGVTPGTLQARYAQIKNRDPNHSIWVVHYAYPPLNPPRPALTYLAAEPPPYCDALMTDTYPVSYGSAEFSGSLWWVASESKAHTDMAISYGKEAYLSVPQVQGWQEFGTRLPTYPEQRYLLYAPVVCGSRGLLLWMYEAYSSPEHQQNVVGPIAREISSLIPAIISNSTAVCATSNHDADTTGHGIGDVTYMFGQDSRGGYLMATNNTAGAISVTFELSGSVLADLLGSGDTSIPVAFESRNVTLQSTGDASVRRITDTMSPYDVNVYRVYSFGDAVSIDLGGPDMPDGISNPQTSDANTAVVANQFGRDCRRNSSSADLYFYFGVSDDFAYQGSGPDVYITIDYFDIGSGTLELQYDADTAYKSGGSITLTGSSTWKRQTFHVTDAYFGNRQDGGADFRIFGGSGNTFYLDQIQVSKSAPGSPVAVIKADPRSGLAPLTVNFDGSESSDPDGTIAAYAWDFDGDGNPDATGPAASHVYPSGGSFTTSLKVTDDHGLTDTTSIAVNVISSACSSDRFSYADGNLIGNGGWTGSASSQIVVENQAIKILGGAGSFDAVLSSTCGSLSGVVSVTANVKRGSGATSMWNLWIDDPFGKNLARWYGSGVTVRGCIGTGSQTTNSQSLSGNWDNLRVDIYTVTNETKFYFNGSLIGTLNHAETGAGDWVGRLKFERVDQSGAAGEYIYLDDLAVVGTSGTSSPVNNLSATPGLGQVTLSWTNPTDPDFASTMIRYRTGGYPTSPADGNLLCDRSGAPGSSDTFTHVGAENTTYYYAAFAYGHSLFYSAPAYALARTLCLAVWLNENFDGYVPGDVGGQGGWVTTGLCSAQSQSAVVKGSSGKAPMLDSVSCNGSIADQFTFGAKTGGYHYVSLDVLQDATGAIGQEIGFVSFQTSAGVEIARLRVQRNRLMMWYGSGSAAVFTTSAANLTWYALKIGFNVDLRTMDLWLGTTPKGKGYAWIGSGTNLGRIVVGSDRNTNLNPQKMYVDNLLGEAKPTVVDAVNDDGTWTPSVTKLHFSFDAADCAGEYRYAIGTTPGGTQARTWTSCAQATDVTATGLSLTQNQNYYISVQVGTGLGTWGSSTTSNGIKVAPAVGIQAAKALADGTSADVKALRGKLVSAGFAGGFYVQEPDGHYGLKVVSSASVNAGEQVEVCGVMKGSGAERYLDCTGNPVTKTPGPGGPYPVAVSVPTVGGIELNSNTPGVVGGIGPNNVGLLVTLFGKVTQRQTTPPRYFYLDDGSGLKDGATTGGIENVGIRVIADPASYAEGAYVCVQGAVSCFDSSGLRPQIQATQVSVLRM